MVKADKRVVENWGNLQQEVGEVRGCAVCAQGGRQDGGEEEDDDADDADDAGCMMYDV